MACWGYLATGDGQERPSPSTSRNCARHSRATVYDPIATADGGYRLPVVDTDLARRRTGLLLV